MNRMIKIILLLNFIIISINASTAPETNPLPEASPASESSAHKSSSNSSLYQPFDQMHFDSHLVYIISACYVILFVFVKLLTEKEFNYCILVCYKNCTNLSRLHRLRRTCCCLCCDKYCQRRCTSHRTSLGNLFPESTFLVSVGIIVAGVVALFEISNPNAANFNLSPDVVFNILLVPIIMSAAWCADKDTFYRNIGTILWFAIIGTVVNAAILMPFFYYGSHSRWGIFNKIDLDEIDAGMFAILICAVDPVAVLSVFESMHIDKTVYNVVFGESLLNDGVAVVFYKSFVDLKSMPVVQIYESIGIMFCFFVYAFGISVILGAIMAFIISYCTKLFTHIQEIEFVVIFALNYLCYLLGDAVKGSGIIALFFCVLIQRQYVVANLTYRSQMQVKHLVMQLSFLSEGVIFILMGITAFSKYGLVKNTDVGFAFFNILICYVSRYIVIFLLGAIANLLRRNKLNYKRALFIQAHGGLRGAIGFSLAYSLGEEFTNRYYYQTAVAIMVFFSVYILGVTIKPMVTCLEIPLESKDEITLFAKLADKVCDRYKEGIKAIIHSSSPRLKWENFYTRINNKYLKKWFMYSKALERNVSHSSVISLARNQSISEAQDIASDHGSVIMKDMVRNNSDARLSLYKKTWNSFLSLANAQKPNGGPYMPNKFQDEFSGGLSIPDMQQLDQTFNRRDVDDQMTHHNRQEGMGRVYKRADSKSQIKKMGPSEDTADYMSNIYKQPHRIIAGKDKENPEKLFKTFNAKKGNKSVKFNQNEEDKKTKKPKFQLGGDNVSFENAAYDDEEDDEIKDMDMERFQQEARDRKRHVSTYDPFVGINLADEEMLPSYASALPWKTGSETEPEVDQRVNSLQLPTTTTAIPTITTIPPSPIPGPPKINIPTHEKFNEQHSEQMNFKRTASPKLLRKQKPSTASTKKFSTTSSTSDI